MIKKLRRQFVVVTTLMVAALFTILVFVDNRLSKHWMEQDYLSALEFVSNGGVFNDEEEFDKERLFEELTYGAPIFGIVADSEGRAIDVQVVGGKRSAQTISESSIAEMLNADAAVFKIGKYLFKKRTLRNGDTLLVAIAPRYGADNPRELTVFFLWTCLGLVLIVLLARFLSRYVTRPAQRALEREKQFITDASHELKTLLGAILVNAQALEFNGEKSVYVKNIISESERMNRLVEKLLTLSKLENDKLPDKKEFSLSDVVNEMILTYEAVAFEKNHELVSDVGDGLKLMGNEDEIRQLTAILIDNAIKNSDEGAPISFRCVRDGGGVLIEALNTGAGIEKTQIESIFDRFYTTDQSRKSDSFGLGLAIAKAIVERHGGKISVRTQSSEIPERTDVVFSVRF